LSDLGYEALELGLQMRAAAVQPVLHLSPQAHEEWALKFRLMQSGEPVSTVSAIEVSGTEKRRE
jgi:hypothetical protein